MSAYRNTNIWEISFFKLIQKDLTSCLLFTVPQCGIPDSRTHVEPHLQAYSPFWLLDHNKFIEYYT
jgi:hypothetical protein